MFPLGNFPKEMVLEIGHHLGINDLRNLALTCKELQVLINSGYLYEEEATEERDFDDARLRLRDNDPSVISFSYVEIARWPDSRVAKYSNNPEQNKEYFNFLDDCVSRWGAGILYFAISTCDLTWNRNLINLLPTTHRRGSLVNRAIISCSDNSIIERVIRAYMVHYPKGILGLKDPKVRRRFIGGTRNNDPVPLFLACSKGRTDLLDLLYKVLADDDFNLVTDDQNRWWYDHTTPIPGWIQLKVPHLMDAWESAFYARDRYNRRDIQEEVCV
ncbi:hypothetical protein PG988_011365 [Apiospora saccharicola]